MAIYSLDEIYFATWHRNQVVKSKSTLLFRFSSLSGKVHRHPDAMVKWKEQLQFFLWTNEYRELFGIDGEPCEFEWNLFSRHTTVEILRQIQTRTTVRKTRPEEFEDRIILMSMFNDIAWTKNGNYNECFLILKWYQTTQGNVRWDIGLSRSWWRTEMVWNANLQSWRSRSHGLQFPWQRTSILQSFQCVGSRILEKGGEYTTHFRADPSNAELLFRTNCSANQLSIYGAIADCCDELTQQIPGKSFQARRNPLQIVTAVFSKIGVWGGEYVGTSTWDECSSSERSTARTPREIRKVAILLTPHGMCNPS